MDSNSHFGPALSSEVTAYGARAPDSVANSIFDWGTGGERAVILCCGGNGRTGHVMTAWLVAARGLSPMEAIESVEDTGRLPREAVLAGNTTLDELIALLASSEPDVVA